jgi:hypothetical protein
MLEITPKILSFGVDCAQLKQGFRVSNTFKIMHNQSNNVVEATQLALLEEKIFNVHPIQEVINANHRMYTDFMCTEEDPFTRQVFTVGYELNAKLLVSIQSKIDPDQELVLQITYQEKQQH